MTDSICKLDLSKDSQEIKDNIDDNGPPKKRNLWYFDVDIRKEYDLSLSEVVFLNMCYQLQDSKEGFCRAKNFYFMDAMGISDDTIERCIKKLTSLNLIWTHYYMTKNGKRRQIVSRESIIPYQSFLIKNKAWKTLKKFREEFVDLFFPNLDPNDPSKLLKKETQTTEAVDTYKEPNKANRKMREDPNREMRDAINTTYLQDRKNGVTYCQHPELPKNEAPKPPAGSGDPCSAASLSNLKEELEQSFSKYETSIGLKWYEMQTDTKRAGMKKPIACIIQALKGGYAQQEVEAKNSEVAAKLQKDREIKQKAEAKKIEMNSNEKLAHQLVNKFSQMNGWRHKLDGKCFVVFNDSVEKFRDEETGSPCCIMPSGKKRFGSPGVRGDFGMSHEEFKIIFKDFFEESQWIPGKVESKEKFGS